MQTCMQLYAHILDACRIYAIEFFLNVSLNSANSVTKVLVITVKGLKPAECYHSTSKTSLKQDL